jgi:RimJ/RimL family protein N-acetyltransferase
MSKVAQIIRSSADWYEDFVDPKDLDQHYVDENWIEENYKKRDFYLAKTDASAVGTISTQFFGPVAYLGYIYLSVDHVGKGYGKRLIDHARDLSLRQPGVESMVLIAHPQAKWAVKAYEKYGFELKATNKNEILSFHSGFMKPYYEEGFHLYEYKL